MRKLIEKFLLSLTAILVVTAVNAQTQFVENKGQWGPKVNYRTDFSTGSFFLENQGFTVLLQDPNDMRALSEMMHGPPSNQPIILHSHAYKVDFLGSAVNSPSMPDKVSPSYNNYFLGDDHTKWAGDCKIYQAVTYQNVYPNIDVRYYSDAGNLKYDIIVKPGGNVDAIAMRYNGVDKVQLKNKELVIGTSVGNVKELYPYSYQVQEGKRQTVDCKYVVRDNVVRFKVGEYSRNSTIVIDPTLIFSTFTGSRIDNWGYTATPGPDGSFFAGGIVFGPGYPVSTGSFQTIFNGGPNEDALPGYDMAIIKFSPDGTKRLYATYLGGSGNEQPHSMICDPQGNLIVAGRTNSTNYPLKPVGNKVVPSGTTGYDIVVTKFNANGTGILGSIKIGGSGDDGVNIRAKYATPFGADATRRNYGDDARSEVILDNSGNIYLASCTQSADFFVTPGTYAQTTFGGGRQDGVILKFNSTLSSVLFSKYFGGNGDDACFVLSLNPVNGNLYVAGGTTSSDLPGDRTGVIQMNYLGAVPPSPNPPATDGFVTEIKADGSAIIKTTYVGTTGDDIVYGIQMDKQGFPYIMGTTTGDWPVISANFSNPRSRQFICKLQPDLSAFAFSTVFGTGRGENGYPNLSPTAFLVDRCQNIYVSGWGGGLNNKDGYPTATNGTLGMPEVNPLPGIPAADGADFYFIVLEKNAQSQLFGSHFGQFGGLGDHVDGGTSRFDANGIIYQAMCANCYGGASFPTTPGVWAMNNGSAQCNEAAVKIEMNFAGVGANIQTVINGIPDAVSGCNPLKITVFDSLSKAISFFWNWGDGTKIDSLQGRSDTSHLFVLPAGVNSAYYTITLIAEDSNKCNIRDTATKVIKVSTNFATLGLSFVKEDPCTNLSYKFTNLSQAFIGSFDNKGFTWDFGDGTTDTGSIGYNPVHRFASPGSYRVKLCVIDTFVCNAPDCVDSLVVVADVVKAAFKSNLRACINQPTAFTNTSTGGDTFIWEFGDGTTSTDASLTITHTYTATGTYNVRLIAFNSNTCNKSDTSGYFTITVFDIPAAKFDFSPNPPLANTPTRFSNLSSGASRYVWDFGDGETSTDVNPVHQYNATLTYHAVLYAYNIAECVDSFSRDIPIIIIPLLDVPNAFTPGRFGTNGIVKVVGFGIGTMSWKIYNRWGQVVFQTTNRNQGWDGRFKGALQAMDVYTYTLDVEFTDGTKYRKTGDISLLR